MAGLETPCALDQSHRRSEAALRQADLSSLSPSEVTAVRFWQRIVGNARSALILINAGQREEAECVNQLAIENLIYMATALRSPASIERMKTAFNEAWTVLLEAATCRTADAGTRPPSALSAAYDVLIEAEQRAFSTFEMAELSDLQHLYTTRYRILATMSSCAFIACASRSQAERSVADVTVSLASIVDRAEDLARSFQLIGRSQARSR